MAANAEVAIIGGGVIGFSAAYHLAKQGIPSQVIEMDGIAAKASGKAMGYVGAAGLTTFESELYPKDSLRPVLQLGWESLRRMPQLAEELKEEGGVDPEYGETAVVYVAFEEEEERILKQRMAELVDEGFGLSWVGPDELRAMGVGLNTEVRGALLQPNEGQVEAYRYVLALAQAAERLGGSIKYGEAVGLGQQGQRVNSVKLASGEEVGTSAVVIAMGPWSAEGASWLGMDIPLEPVRGSCVRVEVPERYPPYWSGHGMTFVSPKVDGSVLVGYPEDRGVGLEDDWVSEEAMNRMVADGVHLVPGLSEARLVETRAGILGYTPDSVPILGRLSEWDNVYIAAGLGTFGICLSPAVGRIMADIIATDRTARTIEPLSPARFGL